MWIMQAVGFFMVHKVLDNYQQLYQKVIFQKYRWVEVDNEDKLWKAWVDQAWCKSTAYSDLLQECSKVTSQWISDSYKF